MSASVSPIGLSSTETSSELTQLSNPVSSTVRAEPKCAKTDSSPTASRDGSPLEAVDANARQAFTPGWRFYATFGVLCTITLAAALDANSISVALSTISQDLGGSAIETFWLGTSFLLASTVLQPTIVSLSNLFGRTCIIMIIVLFFTAGAILGALSQNITVLLVARSIQGIGGGGIDCLCNVLVTDLVPLRERGIWFGFMAGTWAIASVSGPIIGGVFAETAGWRWIFWVNLPFCAIGLIALPIFLRLKTPKGSILSKLAQVDWVGAILLTAALTSFIMPVSWGGVLYPWSSWHTLVPFFFGIFGVAAFVLYEKFVAPHPLIPLRIFTKRTAAVNFIGTTIHGTILWCLLYYLPLYYEAVQEYSPIITGVAIFPETFTVAPVTVIVGILVTLTGRFRWAIWAGWVLTTVGMSLLCLLTPHTTIQSYVFLNLVPGIGTGLLFASTEYAIQAAVPERDCAFAEAMFTFLRTFGQSIGVALGGVIFQAQLRLKLEKIPLLAGKAEEYAKEASSLVQVIKAMDRSLPERALLITAYSESLRTVWAVMAGLGFVALILSLFTEGLSLDRELETEHGFIHE